MSSTSTPPPSTPAIAETDAASPAVAPAETLRLTAADFDALARSQGNSPARVGLTRRMNAWSEVVVARLAEIGVATSGEGRVRASADAARMYFVRDRAGRSELRREREAREKKPKGESRSRSRRGEPSFGVLHESNAFLALTIARTFVEVSFEVPPEAEVDAKNLRARLADPSLALELVAALERLPEQFVIGLGAPGDEDGTAPAHRADADQIRLLVDRSVETGRPFAVAWRVPRDLALEHASDLAEQLEDAIVALGAIYTLVTWSVDNDWLARDRTSRNKKRDAEKDKDQQKQNNAADNKNKKRRTHRSPRDARPLAREKTNRRDAPDALPLSDADPASGARAPLDHAASPAFTRQSARIHSSRSAFAMRTLRSSHAVVTGVDPSMPIEKGARVRVLAGPFMGKIGIVQEVDGKGGARVMLGLLATRVDIKDLIGSPEGRERPALGTSHRKPLPAR